MSEEFGDVRDDLHIEDGEAHCPHDDCEKWWPAGMEYAYLRHAKEHEDGDDE